MCFSFKYIQSHKFLYWKQTRSAWSDATFCSIWSGSAQCLPVLTLTCDPWFLTCDRDPLSVALTLDHWTVTLSEGSPVRGHGSVLKGQRSRFTGKESMIGDNGPRIRVQWPLNISSDPDQWPWPLASDPRPVTLDLWPVTLDLWQVTLNHLPLTMTTDLELLLLTPEPWPMTTDPWSLARDFGVKDHG